MVRWLIARSWFGPAVLAGLFLLILALLLSLLRLQVQEGRLDALNRTAKGAHDRIKLHLDGNRDYLRLMADDIVRGAVDEPLFVERGTRYIADHGELLTITFADADSVVRWVAPAEVARHLQNQQKLPQSRPASQMALKTREPAYSGTFVGIQGVPVWEIHVPVFREDEFLGSIVGTYSAEQVLRQNLPREVFQGYQVRLLDQDGGFITGLPAGATVDDDLVHASPLMPPGGGIQLELTSYAAPMWNWSIMLLALLCMALVVGMAWGMWALSRQITQRVKAEEALRDSMELLERRVRERTSDLQSANESLQQAIIERKRIEQRAMEHQHQLAHVARLSTMGEMAAGLAHELNQPLGAIASYSQGCVQLLDAGEHEGPELRHALGQLTVQANRAGRIIHRLREFIVDSTPEFERVEANVLLREVAELLEADARQGQVEICYALSEHLPITMADGIQVQQVVLNLMRNSIEAMQDVPPDQRKLTVRTALVDDRVEIVIADTGPPVSEETLRHMFDAFYTTKKTGMGMGLSISRTIIEAHGGRLWPARNPGGGLSMRFTLPTANGEADE